jgi:hypothetical protein
LSYSGLWRSRVLLRHKSEDLDLKFCLSENLKSLIAFLLSK